MWIKIGQSTCSFRYVSLCNPLLHLFAGFEEPNKGALFGVFEAVFKTAGKFGKDGGLKRGVPVDSVGKGSDLTFVLILFGVKISSSSKGVTFAPVMNETTFFPAASGTLLLRTAATAAAPEGSTTKPFLYNKPTALKENDSILAKICS